MARWYTSDHHFGHTNIIKYCSRPFPDADAMDKAMVLRWNEVVDETDEVWILGDLVMGSFKQGLAGHVARLKGHKILVPGNHDRCWKGHKSYRRKRADYTQIGGVHEIIDDPEPHIIASETVLLDHFPYKLDEQFDGRFAEYRPTDGGSWLLHGHIHEKWRQQQRQINVGVDAWNFAPVSEDTIAAIIAKGPANTPAPDYSKENG